MGSAVRILFLAIIFLLPGGSLVLAGLAARSAVKNRSWLKVLPPAPRQ
ncbi:MAG TPA: hypothetical protein VMB50_08785 [Myxococcales bacterium]|nr:hypothetical protein [Myxococcales bacterium]